MKDKHGYGSNCKYSIDENVLCEETNFKYYLLGLFAADGYIGLTGRSKKTKYIVLSLNKRDEALLLDIKRIFKTDRPLHASKDMLRFHVCSSKLYDSFFEWGIVPRKSKTLQLQKEIPDKFIPYFLLGVFDGDGSISNNRNSASIVFCTTASPIFAKQIIKLYNKINIFPKVYKRKVKVTDIRLIGRPGLEALNKLYSAKGLYMPRKYEKFLNFIRMTLDETMMETAYIFSKRSTCVRLKVGCVLTDENKNNIISIGYNGGVIGLENHCESIFPGQCGCIHAELGTLIKGQGPILYCTHMPCRQCAKLIANARIKKVYYSEIYRNKSASVIFSKKNIKIKQLKRKNYIWKLNLLELNENQNEIAV